MQYNSMLIENNASIGKILQNIVEEHNISFKYTILTDDKHNNITVYPDNITGDNSGIDNEAYRFLLLKLPKTEAITKKLKKIGNHAILYYDVLDDLQQYGTSFVNLHTFDDYLNDVKIFESSNKDDELKVVSSLPLDTLNKLSTEYDNDVVFVRGSDNVIKAVPDNRLDNIQYNKFKNYSSSNTIMSLFALAIICMAITVDIDVTAMLAVFGLVSFAIGIKVYTNQKYFNYHKKQKSIYEKNKNFVKRKITNNDYVIAEYHVRNDNVDSVLGQMSDNPHQITNESYQKLLNNSVVYFNPNAMKNYVNKVDSIINSTYIVEQVSSYPKPVEMIEMVKSLPDNDKILEIAEKYDDLTEQDKRDYTVCVTELVNAKKSLENRVSFVDYSEQEKLYDNIVEKVNTVVSNIDKNYVE